MKCAVCAVLVVAAACRGDRKAPVEQAAPTVGPKVVIECPDGERTVEARDLPIDDALCGTRWTAWEIDARRTAELVHAQAGRTLRLRRRGSDAVVEVLAGGQVESQFDGVTRIRFHTPPTPHAVEAISLTRGKTTEKITLADLAARYPDVRRLEIPLCLLFDKAGPTAMVHVVSADGHASTPVTRAECERNGLVLRTNNRGSTQLRDRTGQRLVVDVTGVVIEPGDTLAR